MTRPEVSRDRQGAGQVAVLSIKAGFEERWMLLRHPGYVEYRRRTRRFVPFVF